MHKKQVHYISIWELNQDDDQIDCVKTIELPGKPIQFIDKLLLHKKNEKRKILYEGRTGEVFVFCKGEADSLILCILDANSDMLQQHEVPQESRLYRHATKGNDRFRDVGTANVTPTMFTV